MKSPQEPFLKTAVVLMNLGGPDSLKAVRPFLFQLFYDPHILPIPLFFRYLLAGLISFLRAPFSRRIYGLIGGKSPLLENTLRQAALLEAQLNQISRHKIYKVFVSMRYARPRCGDVLRGVELFRPDKIVLLPLYPHYSTTTTGSSFQEFRDLMGNFPGLSGVTTSYVEEYAEDPFFVESHVQLILECLLKNCVPSVQKKRILFSAHSLPMRVIERGDPYAIQIKKTVLKIVQCLKKNLEQTHGKIDFQICYQSRAGFGRWLGPSLGEEIKRASQENKGLVVVPISFVSEHCETLYELDVLYKEMAEKEGVPSYERIPSLGVHKKFIETLINLVLK